MVPPLYCFAILRYLFLVTDPKIFLKAPLALIYTNFEGTARAEKTRFFGQNFPKIAEKRLFGLFFFKILSATQKIWSKSGLYSDRRAQKINLVNLKKVDKNFEIFGKSASLRKS